MVLTYYLKYFGLSKIALFPYMNLTTMGSWIGADTPTPSFKMRIPLGAVAGQ